MKTWCTLVVTLLVAACSSPVKTPTSALSIVSFNVRYGTAKDGANAWEHRRDLVVQQIAALDPDVWGAQEMLPFQSDYVEEALPAYTRIGVGRVGGGRDGEYAAIYFRKSRFTALESGHFWLSDTPEVVGSNGWDALLPRIATWVRLRDRDGTTLFVLNTHFDHVGEIARAESAKLVRSRIAGEARVVVMGDFNAAPFGAPYSTLVDGGLVDTFRAVHDEEMGGTFHGFGELDIDARIDWILVTPNFDVMRAGIERTNFDGRWASDHHPVSAVLRRRE